MRQTWKQIRAHLAAATPLGTMASGRVRTGVYVARLGVRILQQWARDRCPQQAAALSFETTLSLVPVLAVALALLRSTGARQAEAELIEFVANQMLPGLDDLAQQLRAFADRVTTGAMGAGGLLVTLVTCYTLYVSVERVFNDIWKSTRTRRLLGRFLTFYALVTLVPALAATSLYWSGKLLFVGGLLQFIVPLALQFAALLITNKLLPTCFVTWRAALVGATVTGLALELLKLVFVGFAKRVLLASYSNIYGTVALLPLLLVWIYASWLLVLLGVEIANAVQNARLLEAEDRRREGEEPINGVVALQLLTAIAADHARGGPGVTRVALAESFGLTPQAVEVICDRLKARGYVAEVVGDKEGYIPGRAPDGIAVEDVLSLFRGGDLQVAHGRTPGALAELVDDLEQQRRARLAGVTVAQLLERGNGASASRSAIRVSAE